MRHIDIGVFAHNEESEINAFIGDLAKQSLINHPDIILRIRVLCNGCTDDTVRVARNAVAVNEQMAKITVVEDFEKSGKSRTWNSFVSEIDGESHFTIFMDADIRITDSDALLKLIEDLAHSEAAAVTSRPQKDLSSLKFNPFLYLSANTIKREHKDGPISGQLYAVKTEEIRQIRLPVPCLVEDGFLSACLITGLFSHPGRPEKVKASDRVSHFFKPPKSIYAFFRHDVRLALGCELNAALYSNLWSAKTVKDRIVIMEQFAEFVGIDQSIDEHQRHPERSALRSIRIFSGKKNRKNYNLGKIVRYPICFAHAVYKTLVRYRAKKLFAARLFQW